MIDSLKVDFSLCGNVKIDESNLSNGLLKLSSGLKKLEVICLPTDGTASILATKITLEMVGFLFKRYCFFSNAAFNLSEMSVSVD